MSRPTRATAAGRAYLDLQNRARREHRTTSELLTLYVVERWLARLSRSDYADRFILKGGMLLAAFDARRATADADALARGIPNEPAAVTAAVAKIAALDDRADGVQFLHQGATSRIIRDQALYAGIRIMMDTRLSTAQVRFRIDVNFGDPVTPAPLPVILTSLRPTLPDIRVLGYPTESLLAEKIATAINLGAANTRIRDYVDVYTLTGQRELSYQSVREALLSRRRSAPLRCDHCQPRSITSLTSVGEATTPIGRHWGSMERISRMTSRNSLVPSARSQTSS
jgi:Nucleotidyl transferase AbiEii toxin, Type IV TA system